VNYLASHDDRGWVDNITENPPDDGSAPTDNDLRRARLACGILMMPIGIPMLTACGIPITVVIWMPLVMAYYQHIIPHTNISRISFNLDYPSKENLYGYLKSRVTHTSGS
jgi:hypothetical protein